MTRDIMVKYVFLTCIFASWVLAVFSLGFPVFMCKDGDILPVTHVLCCGWCGIMTIGEHRGGFGNVGWYANPLFILANIFYFRKRFGGAAIAGACSLALSLTSLALQTVASQGTGRDDCRIEHFGAGFYLWLSSMGMLFIGTIGAYSLARFASTKQVL